MQLLTGQDLPTSGQVRLFGEDPYENPDVLARTCFVAEGQTYPDSYRVCHVVAAARLLHPRWDERVRPPAARRVRPAAGTPGPQALPRDALGAGRGRRPGVAGRADLLRRALPRAGRRGAAALLRPAARRLRRAPAHRRAVHPPDRRGGRPARARRRGRPRPGAGRRGRRRAARRGGRGQRPVRRGRRGRQRTPGAALRADGRPRPGHRPHPGRGRRPGAGPRGRADRRAAVPAAARHPHHPGRRLPEAGRQRADAVRSPSAGGLR